MSDRRSFLRGLAALPLIGGSITLIGNPTAAAVPASRPMLADYADFLGLERWRTLERLYGTEGAQIAERSLPCYGAPWHWHQTSGDPSNRAAVILSAAGVPLTEGWRL